MLDLDVVDPEAGGGAPDVPADSYPPNEIPAAQLPPVVEAQLAVVAIAATQEADASGCQDY